MTRSWLTAWRWLWWFGSCCSFLFAHVAAAAEPLADADGDRVPDLWETRIFKTDAQKIDTDGDGFPDGLEMMSGFDPLKARAMLPDHDADADGLADRLELLFGTDPLAADTDLDGYADGTEVRMAYSPTTTGNARLAKSIRITLSKQRLEQRVMNIPISSHPISGGLRKTPTPVGDFRVLKKIPRAWSRSAKLWMPYWMDFSGRGYGMHELPEWPGGKKEGANHLGRPASHGCVRLGVGPAKALYEWTPEGTPVSIVYDDKSATAKIARAK